MTSLIIGLITGFLIGANLELFRNIANAKYFQRDKKNKSIKVNYLDLLEIKIKLFMLKIYEEKKTHLIVLFYCTIVAGFLIAFTLIDTNPNKPGTIDRFFNIMNRIERSIRMDWGR